MSPPFALVDPSYPVPGLRSPQRELLCEELSFSLRFDVVEAEPAAPVCLTWPYPLPIPSDELIAMWIEVVYLGNYCQQLVPHGLQHSTLTV